MMDAALEDDLKSILHGETTASEDVVDVLDAKLHSELEKYIPITKKTVTYIVAGVFFNDNGDVLMMQEAKSSCYKEWYLPAGRMEPNETIEEGIMREVKEETGLTCKPTTVICVEALPGPWIRFTMTGIITGGQLKSYAQRDSESLQADWFPVETITAKAIPIRSSDIFQLINLAVTYRSNPGKQFDLQPLVKPHKKLTLRLLVVYFSAERKETMILVGLGKRRHLPTLLMGPGYHSLLTSCCRLVQAAFGTPELSFEILGVLSVEHCGRPAAVNDGLRLTIMASVSGSARPDLVAADRYAWLPVTDDDVRSQISERLPAGRLVRLIAK